MSSVQQQIQCDVVYISPFQYRPDLGVTYLQGIKGGDRDGTYILTGAINSPQPTALGLVYVGPIDNVMKYGASGSGTWHLVKVPTSLRTKYQAIGISIYGPENLGAGFVNLVGAYMKQKGSNPDTVGFAYTGNIDGSTADGYRSVQGIAKDGPATYTFLHSVSGGLAVGNCDTAAPDNLNIGSLSSTAFIYELATGLQIDIQYPGGNTTHTAYGIWYNGNGGYTIAGGSGPTSKPGPVGLATLIDYNHNTGEFSNYIEYNYRNDAKLGRISHFEGIWSDGNGKYVLPATSQSLGDVRDRVISVGSIATVERDKSTGRFCEAQWCDLQVSDCDGQPSLVTTNNSLYDQVSIGFTEYGEEGQSEGTSVSKASFVAVPHLPI